MSKCIKTAYDFCGNVNMVNASSALTMDYFQYFASDVDISSSAWICHFVGAPIDTSEIGTVFFRYIGAAQIQGVFPPSEWWHADSSCTISFIYLLDDFDQALTWTDYNSLTKSEFISDRSYNNNIIKNYQSMSGNVYGEDGSHGSYIIQFTPVTVSAYGLAIQVDNAVSSYSELCGYHTLHHPEVLSNNGQIRDNYLLLRAIA